MRRHLNRARPGLLASVALSALVTAGLGACSSSSSGASSGSSGASARPSAAPEVTTDKTSVEKAVEQQTGCAIDEKFGRDDDAVRFVLTAVGPSDVTRPHEPLPGSFVCESNPKGSMVVVGVLLAGPQQVADFAAWLAKDQICRPVAIVGPWVLASVKPADAPQNSPEFGKAVSGLGGAVVTPCP